MISRPEKIQEVERLTRSESHLRILDELRERGPMNRAELEERIDVSRTTIQRNLDNLVEQGWIEEERREYSINPCGGLVATGFDELLEKIDTAERLQPFFRWIPESEFDFGIEALVDANVTVITPGHPYAPVEKHIEGLERTSQFFGLLPSVSLNPLKVAYQRTLEENAEYEMVLGSRTTDVLHSKSEYSDRLQEMVTTGRTDLFVTEDIPAFYLGILDDTVQIGVEDDDNLPRALLETRSQEIRDWARSKFNQQKEEAELFSFT